MHHELNIKKLAHKEEMLKAYKIIKQRYPNIDFNSYEKQLIEMIEMNDFKIIAAFWAKKSLELLVTGFCACFIAAAISKFPAL